MITKTNPKNWEILHDYYKNNLYYSDISQKDEYMKKHGIKFDTLPNGIRLFGAVSISSDKKSAYTILSFERGSLLDPNGKEGLHHLYEHIATSNDFINFAGIHNTNWNASTSTSNLNLLLIDGPWNSKYSDYGNLPVFKRYIETELFSTKHITEDLLVNQKKVITAEIEQEDLRVSKLVWRKERGLFYGESSNRNVETLGTIETLNNITLSDIKDIPNNLLGTNNLYVGLYVVGTQEDFDYLYDSYYSILSKVKSKKVEDKTKDTILDPTNFSKLPEVLEIEVPSFDKGLSSVNINYILEQGISVKQKICFTMLISIFRKVFFSRFRKYNLESYQQIINQNILDYRHRLLYTGCTIKHNYVKEAKHILKESLYDILDDSEFLKESIRFKLLDELATPNSTKEILESFVEDIMTYGDIFYDFDKSSQIRQSIIIDDFEQVIQDIKKAPYFFEIIRQKD